jgi:uncharacterized damage-inducible protein DinB
MPEPWFERKFEFTLAPEELPNLLARLRGTPARLDELLRNAPAEVLTLKPEGQWSAQEHAGHLADLETLWLARVEDYAANRDRLTPADLTNRMTNEANHNGKPRERILSDFRAARARLLDRVAQLEPSIIERTLPHPRLQTPMRLLDHLYFVAEHDDHHLARIWELL